MINQVPSDFKPTWSGRGWIINPIHPDNPWWIIPGAMLPAALATILLFLDQQITAVIVNRKENKLKVRFRESFCHVAHDSSMTVRFHNSKGFCF